LVLVLRSQINTGFVLPTFTAATNNYGFYSDIASGSNRWNFYAAGTAQNYFAGNVGVKTTSIGASLEVVTQSAGPVPLRVSHPGNTTFGTIIQVRTTAGTDDPYISWENYNGGSPVRYGISCTDSGAMAFMAGAYEGGFGTERARISSAGGLSVGTTADPGSGGIFATANITAYYSDARLKDFKGKIGDALNKVSQLNGYYYTENQKAEEFGYNNKELQVGVSAQEVKAVLPEVVTPAPFDLDADGKSKSGDDYMTVRYEKLVPLLIEAIKELKAEVEALKAAK
jgi:hypothetical protein